jgi:hypothetical protein
MYHFRPYFGMKSANHDNPTSLEDIDEWGRYHRRLARAAFVHFERATEAGDERSADAWSRTYCRHSKEIHKLMILKRAILLDVYKLG